MQKFKFIFITIIWDINCLNIIKSFIFFIKIKIKAINNFDKNLNKLYKYLR